MRPGAAVQAVQEPEQAPVPEGLFLASLLGRAGQANAVSSGEQVMLLQLLLTQLGFKPGLSGSFDIGTVQAVRNLQLKAKLPVTGQADGKTRQWLNPRLEAWKKQLADQLGKAEREITLADLQDARPRKAATAVPAGSPDERVFGPPRQGISEAPEIELIHKVLRKLGLAAGPGPAYDAQTYAGVRSFQARHKLRVTGLVDPATLAALQMIDQQQQAAGGLVQGLVEQLQAHAIALDYPGAELSPASALKWKIISLQLQAQLEALQQPLPAGEQALENLPQDPEPPRPLLTSELGTKGPAGIVSQGIEVERLQELLSYLGYEIKSPGHFDLQTFGEVRRFQQAQGIYPSGLVDLATRQLLNPMLERRYAHERFHEALLQRWRDYVTEAGLPVSAARWQGVCDLCLRLLTLLQTRPDDLPALQALGLPERLSEDLAPGKAPELEVLLLQLLLADAGFDCAITADYDVHTIAAVRSFQTQHKLPMNGRVDARTREQINRLMDHEQP